MCVVCLCTGIYCSMSMSIVVEATHSPELYLAILQNRFANSKKISFVNVRVFMPEINFTRRNVAHEKSFRSLEILREWFHRVVHRQRDVIANWNCPSVCRNKNEIHDLAISGRGCDIVCRRVVCVNSFTILSTDQTQSAGINLQQANSRTTHLLVCACAYARLIVNDPSLQQS